MEMLKLGDVLALVHELRVQGMPDDEIKALPVYIGDDEELNGIHNAFYCQQIDAQDKSEDGAFIAELINENSCNYELKGKAILIS